MARSAPGWSVRNFAVPGYSTLQAQMLYERLLGESQRKPRLVVYGYGDFHDLRNTAAPGWIVGLRSIAGENEWIALPYARWDAAQGLRTFPPKSYLKWPLSDYSALVRLVNSRLTTLGDVARKDEQGAVTLALLDRWKQRTEREGSEFLTMILTVRPRLADTLPAALDDHGVSHLSCFDTGFPSPKTMLPDGHPNELVNRSWADCFTDWFDTWQARPPA